MKKALYLATAAIIALGISSCSNNDKETKEETTVEQANDADAIDENKTQDQDGTTGATTQQQAQGDTLSAVTPSLNQSDFRWTQSGLGYQIIKDAQGPKPAATSLVNVYYTGMHTDGSVFDGTQDRPMQFPLTGVIAGFSEGIQMMSPGAKYRFYIPSNLAYGQRGAGNAIGPNEDLIFDIELVDFQ